MAYGTHGIHGIRISCWIFRAFRVLRRPVFPGCVTLLEEAIGFGLASRNQWMHDEGCWNGT